MHLYCRVALQSYDARLIVVADVTLFEFKRFFFFCCIYDHHIIKYNDGETWQDTWGQRTCSPMVLCSVKIQGLGGQRTCSTRILIKLGAMDEGSKEHAAPGSWIQLRVRDWGAKNMQPEDTYLLCLTSIYRDNY